MDVDAPPDGSDRDGTAWNDPEPPGSRARRTRYRLAGGAVGLVVGIVVFRGSLVALAPLLWPPGGARWFTLVAVTALSLMLPLMVGAALGEAFARWREGANEE